MARQKKTAKKKVSTKKTVAGRKPPSAKATAKKKAPLKRKSVKAAPKPGPRKAAKTSLPPVSEREMQMSGTVRAPFETPPPPDAPAPTPQTPPAPETPPPPEAGYELPNKYGVTRLVLLVRDPYWLYTYWEATAADINLAEGKLAGDKRHARLTLRLYDATGKDPSHLSPLPFEDIEVGCDTGNWYLNVNRPNHVFLAELGLKEGAQFIPLTRSNVVCTPRAGISEVSDERWTIPYDLLERLYRMAGGLRSGLGSEELMAALQQRLAVELSSGVLPSSPTRKGAAKKDFFLWCDTELVLYGGTEPDAELTVNNKRVRLRPDGTFSIRFALPNGRIPLKVRAVKQSGDETREIEIHVEKNQGETK